MKKLDLRLSLRSFFSVPLLYGLFITFFVFSLYFYYSFYCKKQESSCQNHFLFSSLQSLEEKIFDLKLSFFRSKKISNKIVLLTVDEKSLKKIGRWPWRRDRVSKIIEKIFSYQPSLLTLDMVFSEPSSLKNKTLNFLQKEKSLPPSFMKSLQKSIQKKDPDFLLSQSFSKHKEKIVFGSFYNYVLSREEKRSESQRKKNRHSKPKNSSFLTQQKDAFSFFSVFDRETTKPLLSPLTEVEDWVENTPLLSPKDSYQGFFNADLSQDGSIRKSCLVVKFKDSYSLSLAFQAFLMSQNYRAEMFLSQNETNPNWKKLTKIRILNENKDKLISILPLNSKACLLIHYIGKQKTFPYISVQDLMENNDRIEVESLTEDGKRILVQSLKKKDFLKDKVILFGVTAKGVFDMRVTPLDKNFPGLEIHANILNTLINKNFLHFPHEQKKKGIFFLFLFGLFLSFLFQKLNATYSLLTFLLISSLYLAIDSWLFAKNGVLLSSLFPLSLLFFEYSGITLIKYFLEEKEKRKMKKTFSQYVSPSIFREILSHSSDIQLEGKKENVTVSFLDIRNFTQISEKMDPLFLNHWLSEHFTSMTKTLLKHHGTLDKYIGDAILSFFGAPIKDEDHAHRACLCALEQVKKVEELKEEFIKKSWPIFQIGISLNTGECYVGDIGSENLRNYTVLGEVVNVASRLEGLNAKYGTRILIGEETYKKVKKDFLCRKIDEVYVKGKSSSLSVYELLGKKEMS